MKVDVQKIRDSSEGIIQRVDESIVPPNSVYLAVNLLFDDTLGRGVVRNGTTRLGSQIAPGKPCLGLYEHITTGGTKVPLSVFNDAGDGGSTLYKYIAGNWSSAKTGLQASARMRFETFLNTTVGVNGTNKISSADGSTWATTGGNLDVNHMPACTMVREFLDKVYTAGDPAYPDRLYNSSTPTAGSVSFQSGNGSIDVEPEEGAGSITALGKVPGYLLIYKERSFKRWDTQSTYPESLMNIGTPSQEAVVMTKQSCFAFNQRGVYETAGEYPRNTSRRIKDIVLAIPSSYYGSVSGWGDGERVFYSIGDITIAGMDLTNCVAVYTIDTQVWSLLSFPNEFKRWYRYVDANGAEEVVAGDDDGNVWRVLQGTGDGASSLPIEWMVQYQAQEFGSRGRLKDVGQMVVYTRDVRTGQMFARVDGDGSFKPYGSPISDQVKELVGDLHGRYFDIKIQGKSKAGAHIIGIDFPSININTNYHA